MPIGDGAVFVGQVVAKGGCAMRKMKNIKFKQNVGGKVMAKVGCAQS